MGKKRVKEDISNKLLEKWQRDYLSGKLELGLVKIDYKGNRQNVKNKNRRVLLIEEKVVIVETCLRCKEEKPITFEYFSYGNKGENYLEIESGKEYICNEPKRGCRECLNKYQNKIGIFKSKLLKKYRKDGLTDEWYNSLPNYCAITGIPLIEDIKADFKVSINRKDNTKKHTPDNCEKIAFEINIQQQEAIQNLSDCWKDIISKSIKEIENETDTTQFAKEMEMNWNKSSKDNGVNVDSSHPDYGKERLEKCLYRRLDRMARRYIGQDRRSAKRKFHNDTPMNNKDIYKKLCEQKWKCAYSGIPLVFNRNHHLYWSLDRIDNNKHHTYDNTVIICRTFNTQGGLNRKKFLYILLHQNRIQISSETRLKIENEYNAII